MTDIPPIQGPVGPPPLGPRRQERTDSDADKFKKELQIQRSKVGETDPEQQKKRKQQAEEEEEEDPSAEQAAAPPPPIPFNPDQQSPFELQGGVGKISPLESSQPTPSQPPSPHSRSMAVSSTDQPEDQGNTPDNRPPPSPATPQSQTTPQTPSTPQTTYPQQSFTPTTPNTPTLQTNQQPPSQQLNRPPQPTNQQQPTNNNQNSQSTTSSPTQADGTPLVPGKPLPGMGPTVSTDDLAATTPETLEDASSLLKTKGPTTARSVSSTDKQEEDQDIDEPGLQGIPAPAPLSPTSPVDKDQTAKKDKDKLEVDSQTGMPTPQLPLFAEAPTPTAMPTPYTTMTPEMLALFERMAGVMTVLTDSKMTETVMTLSSPKFASSVFFGAQIIIKEYASAPKVFNIQLSGNPQAVTLFKGNADALMAAFQYGNYNFRVNRLDAFHSTERPLFHRKENVSGDNLDQQDKGA